MLFRGISTRIYDNMCLQAEKPKSLLCLFTDDRSEVCYKMNVFAGEWIASIVACLNSVIAGFVLGYSSPTIPQLESEILKHDEISWYGSLAILGGALGGLICHVLADNYGRKFALLMCSLPYAAGWMLIIAATNTYMLYVGRLATGISFGMTVPTVSIYISEIARANKRGKLAMLNNVLKMTGLVCVYGLGIVLSWRWLAVVALFITLLSVTLTVWLPESPRYLILKLQDEEAKASLQWLGRSEKESIEELGCIKTAFREQKEKTPTQTDKSRFYINLLLLIALMFLMEATGGLAIFFYGELILVEAGCGDRAGIGQVIIGSVRVASSLLGSRLADKVGPKLLLVITGGFMMLGCLSMGVHFYLLHHHEWQSNWLPVGSLMVYAAAYSMGWGPIPWFYQAELFDVKTRGISATVGSISTWSTAFAVSRCFFSLQSILRPYGIFWLFSSICMLAAIFAAIFLPDTKQKILEKITQAEQ